MNVLENLLDEMRVHHEAFLQSQRMFEKELATDFNFFNYIKIYENDLSAILSDLFNSDGSHGQGDIFLKSFLERVNIDSERNDLDYSKAFSKPEKTIDNNRRIDVLIKIPFKKQQKKYYAIGIENKIGADDQPNQIKDYLTWLEKEFEDNRKLIYLTPNGGHPSEKSITEEEYNKQSKFLGCISYDDINNILQDSIVNISNYRVEIFVKELIEFIRKNVLGQGMNDREKEDFIQKIKDNEEKIKAAFLIKSIIPELCNLLVKETLKKYLENKDNDKWEIDENEGNFIRLKKYIIKNNIYFEYGMNKNDFNKVYHGFRFDSDKLEFNSSEIQKKLFEYFNCDFYYSEPEKIFYIYDNDFDFSPDLSLGNNTSNWISIIKGNYAEKILNIRKEYENFINNKQILKVFYATDTTINES